jgi:hypothetical protein
MLYNENNQTDRHVTTKCQDDFNIASNEWTGVTSDILSEKLSKEAI